MDESEADYVERVKRERTIPDFRAYYVEYMEERGGKREKDDDCNVIKD